MSLVSRQRNTLKAVAGQRGPEKATGGAIATVPPVTLTLRIRSLVGMRFGRLLVIGEAERRIRPNGEKPRYWNCVCDCGGKIECCTGQLRSGHTTSCGCQRTEKTIARNFRHGHAKRGEQGPEYHTWKAIHRRCSVGPESPDFKYWAGRGISVCERWQSFAIFLADMGPRPSSTHSIDRIDVNGNYEPSNCRWATASEQRRNRRDSVR